MAPRRTSRIERVDLEQQPAQQAGRDDGERQPERAAEGHQLQAAGDQQPHDAGAVGAQRLPDADLVRPPGDAVADHPVEGPPRRAPAPAPRTPTGRRRRVAGAAASAPGGGPSSSSRGPAGRDPARDRRPAGRVRSALDLALRAAAHGRPRRRPGDRPQRRQRRSHGIATVRRSRVARVESSRCVQGRAQGERWGPSRRRARGRPGVRMPVQRETESGAGSERAGSEQARGGKRDWSASCGPGSGIITQPPRRSR